MQGSDCLGISDGQNVCRLAGPVATTGIAIVHWVGCINTTRVQWLAFCQPWSRILGQQCVLKSVNHSIIARICTPFAKRFTDLCSDMCSVFVVARNVMSTVYKYKQFGGHKLKCYIDILHNQTVSILIKYSTISFKITKYIALIFS